MSRIKNNFRILAICKQPLKDVQGAVRAYNMYKHLKQLGCKITYLDGWTPTFDLDTKNIRNWIKVLLFKKFNRDNARIFVENVQPYIVVKILKKLNIPIILDVRDDLNLHTESMGIKISQKGYLERELAQIENFEIAQKILVTSEGYVEYYSKKYNGQFNKKFVVIMNASDPYRFKKTPLPQKPRIGILGGANIAEGFELLIESARIVKKQIPNLSVHIGYRYLPKTKIYVDFLQKNYNEKWVYFYENIGYTSNAPEFYSSLRVCVIPRKRTTINGISTPSKIFDCMASNRPLVVTDLKEQAKIVKEEKCGLVCDFTPEDMAEKILTLLKDRKMARTMGQNGRKAIEQKHNWYIRSKRIIDEIFIKY